MNEDNKTISGAIVSNMNAASTNFETLEGPAALDCLGHLQGASFRAKVGVMPRRPPGVSADPIILTVCECELQTARDGKELWKLNYIPGPGCYYYCWISPEDITSVTLL